MKFYKASEIIERSLRLADINNTDFLTYTEKTQYLQDSWKTVFQWLINKGDKQFVREIELANSFSFHDWTEYELPFDLYQICSLKNKYSGSIVNRHSESQGINSNTYEVVNNRLRLYGVADGPLLLTYWVNPLYLSFPDKDINIDSLGTILSTAGNSVLTSDGAITNLVTGETVGNIEIEDNHKYVLGNGHVFDYIINNTLDTEAWVVGSDIVDANLDSITPPGSEIGSTTIGTDVYKYNDNYYYAPNKSTTDEIVVKVGDSYYKPSISGTTTTFTNETIRHNGEQIGDSVKVIGLNGTYTDWKFRIQEVPAGTEIEFASDGDGYMWCPKTQSGKIPQYAAGFSSISMEERYGVDNTDGTFDSVREQISSGSGKYYAGTNPSDMTESGIYWRANSGGSYYFLKDCLEGCDSDNLVEVDYTPFDLENIVLYKYTITYKKSYYFATYKAADGVRYGITESLTWNTTRGYLENFHSLSSGYYTPEFTYAESLEGYEPIETQTLKYYSDVYPIISLNQSSIITGSVLVQPTDLETIKGVYFNTDKLTVSYTPYRLVENYCRYINFNGDVLFELGELTGSLNTYHDSKYNVFYQLNKGVPQFWGKPRFDANRTYNVNFLLATENYILEGTTDNTIKIYDSEAYYLNEVELPFIAGGLYLPIEPFDGYDSFLINDHYDKVYLGMIREDNTINFEPLDVKDPVVLGLLKYGFVTTSGTGARVQSCIPDTVLNFPNDLYVSLLACDLALRYAMKQNIDASGLNALYTSMQYQFIDSLEQDSGYNRIQNIYR